MGLPQPQLVDLAAHTASDRVCFLKPACNKDEALRTLAEACHGSPQVHDHAAFTSAIFDRERVSSTGIGNGIAVPHAKLPTIDGFTIAIGISRDGVEFEARDGAPVSIMIMIAASDKDRDTYLRVLATVAGLLKDADRRAALVAAEDATAVLAALHP
ncbi:MAG: PTS sugar transporter subunit IIA [Planctomycetota bacterium]|jgi:mannitol/fructose-specific phosphotransferase system IIA component (Ntr-type)